MASRLRVYLNSSIVKKQMMAATGLFFCLFLVGHLAGNLLLLVGPKAFNSYGHALITNPAIYLIEAVMLVLFASHLGMAFKLKIENKMARNEGYAMKQPTGRGATFASSTMPYTGLVILLFVISHILGLKFGPVYAINHGGVEMRDLYRLTIEYFQNPLMVLWYIVAMIAIGIHTSHGFWSAFQSFGLNHPKYNGMIRGLSKFYAFVITVGFSLLPVYCILQGAK